VHTVVNLPWATGLSLDRHSFAGWSDGSATYPEGAAYEVPTTNVELVAVWSANVLRAPTISSDDATNGCVTVSESVMVEITADDGATILYTLDGSDPASCGVAYVGPFQAVEQEVTVKAVAVRAGFFDSDVSTFSFRRRAAGPVECLNLGSGTRFVSFGGSAEWSRVLDADSHDGDAAMRSGVISAGETSSLSIAVYGPGNISFWWKTSSEKIRDRKCDYVAFTVDGNEFAWLGGEADWTNRTFRIRGAGEHVLVWTYGKDESGDAGNDCAWLDEISWNAASAIPEMGDADGPAVSNAVSTTGFADNSVMDAIGGSAVEYAAFREWAASVTNIAGNAEAGVAAVIGNEHAAAAYLLGAERLFANAPQIEFVEARAAADGAGGFTMCVGVTVVDGDSAVRCSAEKVRALFEATSDLRDWYGAARLEPLVTVEASADPTKMRFKASPGDGSAARAFLRIRR